MISRIFLIGLLMLAGLAQAQQYRWVDKDGRVQFTDTLPPAWAKDVRKTTSATEKPAAAPLPFELTRLQQDFPVTLYSAPSCKEGCELARAALNKRGIPFKEVQVWDTDSAEELKQVSGSDEVPTLLVGRSAQRGFEQGAFDALLDSAGYPKAGQMPALSQKAPGAPEGYVPPAGAAKPVTQTGASESKQKAGPYDTSGLTGPAPKPGKYDPSGLQGVPPKPGPYGVPGDAK